MDGAANQDWQELADKVVRETNNDRLVEMVRDLCRCLAERPPNRSYSHTRIRDRDRDQARAA